MGGRICLLVASCLSVALPAGKYEYLPSFLYGCITFFRKFDVTLSDSSASDAGKGPKVYKTKLTKVAEINPE
jgi:hypothetical protein